MWRGDNLPPVEFHRNSTGDFHWAHGTPVEFRVHFSGLQRHCAHDAENHLILQIPCLRGGFRLNNQSLGDRLTTGEWRLERSTAVARRGQSHGSSNSCALRAHSVSRSLGLVQKFTTEERRLERSMAAVPIEQRLIIRILCRRRRPR